MAWQSIISSHPTTDPRSRLFRCGSIILLIDNLKVGSGAVSVLRVRDGRSPYTHLFLRRNKQDDCGTVLHRASLLSSHLHRESLPSGSKRAQRTAAAIAVQLASLSVGSRHHGHLPYELRRTRFVGKPSNRRVGQQPNQGGVSRRSAVHRLRPRDWLEANHGNGQRSSSHHEG